MDLFSMQIYCMECRNKPFDWQASGRFATLLAMAVAKTSRKSASQPLRQRQRRRPSRV